MFRDGLNLKLLSKQTSHALRHDPSGYGLTLDRNGWADVAQLLTALRRLRPDWAGLELRHMELMVSLSRTQRHELHNGKIRALYGHTTDHPMLHQPSEPPEILFHGTDERSAHKILIEGLKPMGRQHVHLSPSRTYASRARSLKNGPPVIMEVQSRAAHQEGVLFYRAAEMVWLSQPVPPKFIALYQRQRPSLP